MTSGTILPSIGPPPPEFRRSFVPEHLRPKSVGQTVPDKPAADPVVQPERKSKNQQQNQQISQISSQKRQAQGAPVSLAGNSAVAVQVQEGAGQKQVNSNRPQVKELTDEEKAEVQRLIERDREVRAHETAHATAGAGLTGTPSFEFAVGPDGVRYAIGGHVDIDVSEVPDDPKATIAKMEVVRAAALAPARPSGQDRAVAAAAAAKSREAQVQLSEQQREQAVSENGGGSITTGPGLDFNQGRPIVSGSDTAVDPSLAPSRQQPISINLVV